MDRPSSLLPIAALAGGCALLLGALLWQDAPPGTLSRPDPSTPAPADRVRPIAHPRDEAAASFQPINPAASSQAEFSTSRQRTAFLRLTRRSFIAALDQAQRIPSARFQAIMADALAKALRERTQNPAPLEQLVVSALPAGDYAALLAAASVFANPQADRILAFGASTWAGSDLQTAGAVASMIDDAGARAGTLARVGQQWAVQDTAEAFRWAASLPDTDQQTRARQAIQSVAPVGVGIQITRDNRSPYPTAASIISGGPAARGGAIRSGDRIVAVADSNNQWQTTDGRSIDLVVGLIRGDSGAPVHLRILPAGASGLERAQEVTIQREQIFLKQGEPRG